MRAASDHLGIGEIKIEKNLWGLFCEMDSDGVPLLLLPALSHAQGNLLIDTHSHWHAPRYIGARLKENESWDVSETSWVVSHGTCLIWMSRVLPQGGVFHLSEACFV